MNPNEKIRKTPTKFECKICDYITCDKKDFRKHCLTAKHISRINPTVSEQENLESHTTNKIHAPNNTKFVCKCGKQYKHMSTLCNHKKTCTSHDIQNNDMILAIFNEVIKQNQEFQKTIVEQFQKTIVEQNNKIIELSSKFQVTNNNNCTTTNAKFNLQFFLNETCKDAMNIMDFVDSVKLQLSDLEKIGNAGFVNGISNIIIKNLKDLDVTKRPLHCTDSKREVLYVKDENKWEKENDEKDKMKKVINKISTKNIQQIPEWVDQHPDCKDGDSRTNNQYLHIVSESMGCCEPANYGKIIHNVSKQVIVDK